MRCLKYCFIALFVLFVCIYIMGAYGEETKKSEEVKKPETSSDTVEKNRDVNNNGVVKEEQKVSAKRESIKKKVPAFWFLLPEK